MKKVLIIGNGISRLSYQKEIEEFDGERWSCNYSFIDFGHMVTRMNGELKTFKDSVEYREKNGCSYKIIADPKLSPYSDEPYQSDEKYRKDSGTSLVAEALHRGYDVYCVGFDLGGHDVYSPKHNKIGKGGWVTRWRIIIEDFGHDRIHFIGHDHLPFLLSNEPANTYAKKYMKNQSHIPTPEFQEVFKDLDESRLDRVMKYLRFETVVNISKRDYTFRDGLFRSGEKRMMPSGEAEDLTNRYPREFKIMEEKQK